MSLDDERVVAAVLATKPTLTSRKLSQLLAQQTPSDVALTLGANQPTLQECERMAQRLELTAMSVTHVGAPDFPPMLHHDPTRSPVLFFRGNLGALEQRRVGIVGTRSATAAGRYMASHISFDLAEQGIATVSGLARGIDAWAHKGVSVAYSRASDRSRLGVPIGVVASGLDVVYPKENIELWNFISEHGLLISESPPGTSPEPYRFPLRNRVLAALSEVIVVVESRATGGSMITVEEAQKRDITVMAVPGSPRNASSAGTNLLLQQGCAPVVSVDDVLVALGLDTRRVHPPLFDDRNALAPDDAALARVMAGDALTLDQLVLRTRRDVVDIAFALGRMESMGWVVNNGGWWEVLGAQTPAGYGGNHGGSHRLAD
ncbi:MAG: DNA-processing protein DprA [Actinomycetes bacterium]